MFSSQNYYKNKIIQIHAPITTHDAEEIDEFYDDVITGLH